MKRFVLGGVLGVLLGSLLAAPGSAARVPTVAPAALSQKLVPRFKLVRVHYWRRVFTGPQYKGIATYYSPGTCDSTGGGTTTASGAPVFFGEVAESTLPFGTLIHVEPAIKGRHDFVIEDRFGSPQEAGRLDVWLPCGDSIPNPTEHWRSFFWQKRTISVWKPVSSAKRHTP